MDINKHLERADEAVRKKNFDYAIALYNQVLAIKPDNGDARAELRKALSRKSDYSRASSFVSNLQGMPYFISLLITKLSGNLDNTIRACERFLQVNPKNIKINFLLGNTLAKAGYLNSAIAVFEFIEQVDKGNTEALKIAGSIKYRNHDISGALELYEKVLKIDPRDAEAEKMRKNLAAEGTLAKGAYSTAGSSQELIKEKEEAAHLQRKTRLHKTDGEIEAEIDHLLQTTDEAPDNKRAMRELGELFVKQKDYSRARAHYKKMLEAEPDSFELRCLMGDLDIKAYTDEIEKLEDRLQSEDNDNLKDDLKTLGDELLSKQVDEYAWRVKDHPTDLGLWFIYGKFVFSSENIDEAIKAFQHSVKDPRHKTQSLHMLGKSFFRKGLYELAEKQLKTALEAAGGVTEKTKTLVYDLGMVAEENKDPKSAMDWYLKIFEIDINYKDVAAKIEKLRQN